VCSRYNWMRAQSPRKDSAPRITRGEPTREGRLTEEVVRPHDAEEG